MRNVIDVLAKGNGRGKCRKEKKECTWKHDLAVMRTTKNKQVVQNLENLKGIDKYIYI